MCAYDFEYILRPKTVLVNFFFFADLIYANHILFIMLVQCYVEFCTFFSPQQKSIHLDIFLVVLQPLRLMSFILHHF